MAACRWLMIGLAAMALSPMAALAQPPGPPPPGAPDPRGIGPRPEWNMPGPFMADAPGAQLPGADPFQLLENNTEVQADLGLTRHQLDNLHLAGRNFRNTLQELLSPRPGIPEAQARAEIQRHVESTREMIARELNPRQLARLQQIMIQVEGPCLAIIDRELGQKLNFSAEQYRAVRDACRQRATKMRSAFRPPAPGQDFCAAMAGNRENVEAVRARMDQQIVALLMSEQQATLNGLMGARIRLEPPQMPNCPN